MNNQYDLNIENTRVKNQQTGVNINQNPYINQNINPLLNGMFCYICIGLVLNLRHNF